MFSPGIPSKGSFYLSSFMDPIVANSVPPILAGISRTGAIFLIDLVTRQPQIIPPLNAFEPTAISQFIGGYVAFGYTDSSTALLTLFPKTDL
jgi:hypothetical protein